MWVDRSGRKHFHLNERNSLLLLTLKDELLHFNLEELVGTDDDAVAGQMDAAAGLQSFNFLWDSGKSPALVNGSKTHPRRQNKQRALPSTVYFGNMLKTGHTHLANAVFVEAVIVA